MATNAGDDAAVGALPDELLLDIFRRLLDDPVELLRCVGTCKRWLRVAAADGAVLLRRAGVLPEKKNASLLLGAFYQNVHPVPGSATTVNIHCPPRFWRLDDLARSGRFLSKRDGLFNYAKPLASRGGLLLVRLMPAPLDYRKLHLAVCHPLLGGVHHIPPPLEHLHPPFLGRDLTGYALLTGSGGEGLHNHRHRRLAFQVLYTVVRHGVVYAYSYSSATGSWSAPTMCPMQLRNLTMSGPRTGVVDGRGTTHWLYRDMLDFYTLDISADAAHVSLTKIPIPVQPHHRWQLPGPQPPFPFIAEGGKLSFVFIGPPVYNIPVLMFCTKRYEDGNNEEWIHYELPMSRSPNESFKFIGFAESRGALLVKTYSGLSCLDLEKKELELLKESEHSNYPRKVCSSSTCQGYTSCIQCAYNNCVLYEMDWSSYLLHLSAWSPREATK